MSKYFINLSDPAGGKAGRGRNKTTTVQVCQPLFHPCEYLLIKSFRYVVGDNESFMKAWRKAQKFVAAQASTYEAAKGTP